MQGAHATNFSSRSCEEAFIPASLLDLKMTGVMETDLHINKCTIRIHMENSQDIC